MYKWSHTHTHMPDMWQLQIHVSHCIWQNNIYLGHDYDKTRLFSIHFFFFWWSLTVTRHQIDDAVFFPLVKMTNGPSSHDDGRSLWMSPLSRFAFFYSFLSLQSIFDQPGLTVERDRERKRVRVIWQPGMLLQRHTHTKSTHMKRGKHGAGAECTRPRKGTILVCFARSKIYETL